METLKPRKRAGRPKGTGYPKDVERIGLVRDVLSSGEFPSRRAAIVAVVGPDPSDIRRMERKMTELENDRERDTYKQDVAAMMLDAIADAVLMPEEMDAFRLLKSKGPEAVPLTTREQVNAAYGMLNSLTAQFEDEGVGHLTGQIRELAETQGGHWVSWKDAPAESIKWAHLQASLHGFALIKPLPGRVQQAYEDLARVSASYLPPEKASDHVDLSYLGGGRRPDEQGLQGVEIDVGNLIARCVKLTGDDWGGDVLLLERIASTLISAIGEGFGTGAEHCMAAMAAALQRLAEKEHFDPMFRQHVPAERFDILIQPGHRPLVRRSSAESRAVGKEAA